VKKLLGIENYSRDPDAINWPWQARGAEKERETMRVRARNKEKNGKVGKEDRPAKTHTWRVGGVVGGRGYEVHRDSKRDGDRQKE
jgi:hypothetical protein